MPSAAEPRIIADKYVVGPLLGRGAVGEVYLARHRLTGAEVALKVIPSRMIGSEPALQRFHREVSVANRIGHPGMVKVYDAGWSEAEDAYYLAMERLYGQSLGDWAAGPEVSWRSGVTVLRAVLEPLAAAHAAGIVHRDLKPENVFLHRDPQSGAQSVKLLDFGIARDQRELQSATLADITLGTPAFMSPEQSTSAKDATPASDVWSVGVMLYWLYSGRFPFEQETVFNTLTAICTLPHPPLEGRTPEELGLIAVIEVCLRKDPADRYPDASALAAALERCGAVPVAEPTPPLPRVETQVRPFDEGEAIRELTLEETRRIRPSRGWAAVVLVALAGGLGWWTWRGSTGSAVPLEASPTQAPSPSAAAAPEPEPVPELRPEPGSTPTPQETSVATEGPPPPPRRRPARRKGVEQPPVLGDEAPALAAEAPSPPNGEPPPNVESSLAAGPLEAPVEPPVPPPPPPAREAEEPASDAPKSAPKVLEPPSQKPAAKKPFVTF